MGGRDGARWDGGCSGAQQSREQPGVGRTGSGWGPAQAEVLCRTCSPGHPNAVPPSRAEGASEDSRAAPGQQDLEAAVQRLSVRQQSHVSEEHSFFEAERERKLWRLRDGASSSGFLTPEGSIVSTGTSYSGDSELTAASSFSLGSLTYFPEKLQIVKPLEGEGQRGCRAAGALRVQHPHLSSLRLCPLQAL